MGTPLDHVMRIYEALENIERRAAEGGKDMRSGANPFAEILQLCAGLRLTTLAMSKLTGELTSSIKGLETVAATCLEQLSELAGEDDDELREVKGDC
jgi:hypothetical protein